ncbi:MAG: hypothetical protein UT41_C0001G0455 [Candidatus Wolfebacteria bacterium GW2011_GWC2_39_22]|uniref:2-phosphoglycerate kinase n=1 Tax=Candidatus Wolfebacteria bacterium GW2011_GWC2_39_22 TaxID=1619013 RepID=A0A0G0NJ92_9BACT|nr:MAG: hypothetical protein UT41_C0001G0455 [Candidatus Wolfebacteria bacterium GW2011_GWC2_39_22]HBI25432.1 hypothetical protein [Candidatus Wolfebacteria bacterium]
MIYLIGGPPKCGKTTLTKTLSKSLGLPWVSTDTLECIIRPYINEKDILGKFPTLGQRSATNDEKFSKYSAKEIIDAYRQQAKTSHQAIEMFAECEIVYGNDFIIEGYHIEPELAAKLIKKYPGKIKSIFLIKSDLEKFIEGIEKSTTPDDWILARTHNKETYRSIANMICIYGNFFEEAAEIYKLAVLNMDVNFDDKIKEAIDILTAI